MGTKRIKLEVTPAQLEAILTLKEDVKSMIGCSDEGVQDKVWTKSINLIERMFKNNGYE